MMERVPPSGFLEHKKGSLGQNLTALPYQIYTVHAGIILACN